LLRPGRFDRHVVLDLPDHRDRIAILQVHTRKAPFGNDVDLDKIAAGSPGFSGADIKNLVNEAAVLAARKKRTDILMQDFEEAIDKVLLGTVSTLAIQPEERHRLAVHEAEHTLARAMVARWGMSEEIGPVDLRESEEHPFLGREIAQPHHYSEHSAEVVDHAVQTLLQQTEQRALVVIREHQAELVRLIAALEEQETLHREQIEQCLGPAPRSKPLLTGSN
jgi:ATP-dependent Zn protease